MENYRKPLKRSTLLNAVFCLITAVVIGLLTWYYRFQDHQFGHLHEFFGGFQTGIGSGLLLLLIISLINNFRALSNEAKLKEMYILENDEREKLMWLKTGLACLRIFIFSIALAAFASGFFNEVVFITLSAVLFFMLITFVLVRFYVFSRN
jgi:hypothetical protein